MIDISKSTQIINKLRIKYKIDTKELGEFIMQMRIEVGEEMGFILENKLYMIKESEDYFESLSESEEAY